ncbi:MAG TPA: cyanophycin synthetase, partial [Candidatus Saccharimonadales bacterium]|nr:cyanophycin synthetase [Candidatus Saccharimonadales bacterium]
WEAIREGAAAVASVPGRLQRIDAGQPFTVVVDYAHTDDALRNVLEVLRPLTPGRLIAVFGCGGDRDRSKRPLMGAHAARLADLVWVTSDNPRGEDPGSIIGMILEGIRGEPDAKALCHVEPDRAKAIGEAVTAARAGDTVLVAGKGHEREQIIGTRVIPFDDVEVTRRAITESLAARREGGGGDAG